MKHLTILAALLAAVVTGCDVQQKKEDKNAPKVEVQKTSPDDPRLKEEPAAKTDDAAKDPQEQ